MSASTNSLAVDRGDAEVGMERREGIVGDLRPSAGHRGQEGRLARIRQADKTGIGNQLQPQPDRLFFARQGRDWPNPVPGW
jgi:hypothetical protein